MRRAPQDLEDYGYLVEQAILFATDLELGTCWLGGTFTKGRFAARMGGLEPDEIMPAVVSLGYRGDDGTERIREREAGSRRLPASSLFFEERFGTPLALDPGDPFAAVLEGVRMAPSASNKQPWRVVRRGDDWHFFLERTKGYGKGSPLFARAAPRRPAARRPGHRPVPLRAGRGRAWAGGRVDARRARPGATRPRVEYTATWRAARR